MLDSAIFARWQRQTVLALVAAHPSALRSLKELAFDVGDNDQFGLASQVRVLDSLLTALDLPHTFDEYPGRHSDQVADRLIRVVLPFFSRVLAFEGAPSH